METEYDGVIGFGLSQSKQSILNVLLANETEKVVSIFVRNTARMRGQDDGRLLIGELDRRHCTSDWKWTKLTSERSWKAISKTILLGNTTILGTNHEIRFNAGSLISFAPKWVVADLVERLGAHKYQGTNLYVIRSVDLKKLPKIRFDFNGIEI
jgi:hypothetical protein